MGNRLLQGFGGLLVAIGALWSLQGAGIVHLKPLLCFTNCAELQGASGQWLATGVAAFAAGAGLWYLAGRRARNARTIPK